MARESEKKSKKDAYTAAAQGLNVGMRLTLIYFAILIGMTFVFLAAPPAHSATQIESTK